MQTLVAPVSKPRSLRTNFSWTFIGNIVYAACQWGMLIVIAKIGTPELVGQFALGLAITAPVFMFTNMQMRAAQSTDAKREYVFGDYLGVRLMSSVVALLMITAITFVSGYRGATALIILIMGLAKGCESVSDVFYGLLQQHERMDRVASSMMLKGGLSLAALASAMYLTKSIVWALLCLTLTWVVTLLFYDARKALLTLQEVAQHRLSSERELQTEVIFKPRWSLKTTVRLLRLTFPLGMTMLLLSLNVNIPRYFIEHSLGSRQLGIYAALSYLLVAESTVVSALGQAAGPRLSQYYAAHNTREFNLLSMRLLGLTGLLSTLAVVIVLLGGRPILRLLYSPEYAEHWQVFAWLVLAGGLWSIASILGYIATACRRIKFQPVALTLVVLVSILTSYLWIARYGLSGVAAEEVVSAAFGVVGLVALTFPRSTRRSTQTA
ncbi:MAG: oligosaccharide flippase family protein [Herpetosiphonaceae bacterium]|nr:oligosaccharide flippase family protein [Herpetosiphonaceae bacterium]